MNGGVTDGSQSWYQKLGDNGDALPRLTKNTAQKTVYQVKEYQSCSLLAGYSLVYRNTPNDITILHQYDANGVCTVCGEVNPDYMTAVNGIYQIATPGQLMWFSAFVNMGNNDASACLTANIDMNTYKWTGLINYSGTFDGKNKTISNLWKNAGMGDGGRWGLTSSLQTGGVIRNLNIDGADIFRNISGGGGVIAGNSSGLIENVLVTNCSIQYGAFNWLGGIVGINRGIIRNCGVVNTVIERRYGGRGKSLGGVTDVNNGTVENCFAYNNAYRNGSATAMSAIIVGGNAPKNSYYSTNSSNAPNTFNENTEKTAAQFASGKIAFLLNNGVTNGSQVWHQTVGTGYPMLEGKTVYSGYNSCGNTEEIYSNSLLSETLPEHQYSDWKDNGDGTHSRVCSKCGDKQTFSHSNDQWTDNGDGTHSRTCSVCKSVQTENHVDDDVNMVCDLCNVDLTVISVTITWGSMEFTYTDASEGTWNAAKCEYENPSVPEWTCDTDANKITVTSESNVDVNVSFRYEATVGVTVDGSFVDEEEPITEAIPIDKGDKTPQMTAVWLKLDGKPEETANKAVMGTVTVTIGG